MIKWLIKRIIPDAENVQDRLVRERYSVLSGALGIVCNFVLFLLKVLIGSLMNSIAIISDGFNNLSDMGSSMISIVSARMSNKKPDKEHPFGHGRVEYIAALVVAFLILLVGVELGKSSFDKVLHPQEVAFSWPLTVILLLSVLVKLWMFSYNRWMGNRIDSGVLLATAKDSINDVFSTSAVVLAMIVGQFIALPVDGIVGLVVSGLILYSGYGVAKDTMDTLLGRAPSEELVQDIHRLTMANHEILGIHDLVVHDYGPGRVMASLHAEVSDQSSILVIHEVIDETEQQIESALGIQMVIHMDPIADSCEETSRTRQQLLEVISGIDAELSMHDFRMVSGQRRTNLIFDLVVPFRYETEEVEKLLILVRKQIQTLDERYYAVIQVDRG